MLAYQSSKILRAGRTRPSTENTALTIEASTSSDFAQKPGMKLSKTAPRCVTPNINRPQTGMDAPRTDGSTQTMHELLW